MIKKSRTCIAVIKNKRGKLVMAGDRRVSWDWDLAQIMPRPKIRKRGELLLGATGDSPLCTLLVDILHIPDNRVKNTDDYIHNIFYSAVYKLLISKGYSDHVGKLHLPEESSITLLVGIKSKLYTIDIINPDGVSPNGTKLNGLISIDETALPFAVGCGANSALPILLAQKKKIGYNTKECLKEAMEIAAEISPGCDNNIDYVSE